ncbi:MAG: twin-arginine translocase TatA/TatE family subunit [Planctomycetaceae bacterium]|nr:twin-arginine translocase TatA/TatE family subunit [Planctomycetaceae bacterium]
MFSGPWEIIIILIVVLLLFGKRLPNAMRSVGQSITAFKKGVHESEQDGDSDDESVT